MTFEEVFKKYYRSLVLYATSLIGEEELAEDIVQNLFVKLWNSKLFSSIGSHQSYLYNATRNACIDYKRLKKNQLFLAGSDMDQRTGDPFEDEQENNTEEERIANLYKIIDSFPPKCKEVFFKVCIENKSYAEAALLLGISTSMVKKQVVKAYKLIREKYPYFS